MVLVDTSIWVAHFRESNADLIALLGATQVLTHPFIIGELSLGSLPQRNTVLHLLQGLPQARIAEHDEVMHFIVQQQLFGKGIGYVDSHLLAATKLTPGSSFWTFDKRLLAAATSLHLHSHIFH